MTADPDEFTKLTDPLKATMPDALEEQIKQQAKVVGTYLLALRALGISDTDSMDLTHHWMDIAAGTPDEDDE